MLVIIDAPMINRFIDDVDSFRKCADDRFNDLDSNGDGLLSREDLRRKLARSVALDCRSDGNEEDVADLMFDKFDVDGNGSIDREEFRPMLMEILIALARGIGSTPVIVGANQDSLVMKAYESDVARIEMKLEKKVKELSEIGIIRRDLKKKRSKKIFGMCACSARYLGED